MSRDGSGVYSAPAGTTATSGTTIESAKYNAYVADITADLNAARPVVAGGTGATTKAGAATSLGLHKGSFYSTYGGTANAITLTTGLSLSALTTGQEFRFRATSANTAATTINVDGIGALTAKTVTGAALPSGYIRTGIDTVCRYDGTDIIVSRADEAYIDPTSLSYSLESADPFTNTLITAHTFTTPAAGVWKFSIAAGVAGSVAAQIQLDVGGTVYESEAGLDVYSPALFRECLVELDGSTDVIVKYARDASSGTANIRALEVFGYKVG